MAANHYLKYVANVSVSWANTGGTQAFVAPGPPCRRHQCMSSVYHLPLLRERVHILLQLRLVHARGLGARNRLCVCMHRASSLSSSSSSDSSSNRCQQSASLLNVLWRCLRNTMQDGPERRQPSTCLHRTEKVYQKLYNQFGVSNESLAGYFGGPLSPGTEDRVCLHGYVKCQC